MSIDLPGYTVEKELGRGGMANVYLAHQHNFDMQVALKVMDVSLLRNPEFGVRFIEEARTMKRLRHNHVVAVNDVGQHGDIYYLSMELLGGGDLKEKVEAGITDEQSLQVIAEIADALDYIHRQGYVHRDIKPENVLFREDGSSVLTDFGIARAVEGSNNLTKTGMVIGTPNYMSPEQAKGRNVDHRSDIYSLGVLLYELLAGELPYKGDSSVSVGIMHITADIPSLPEAHQRYQGLVDRAMAKEPDDRYQSGAEFLADLSLAHQGQLSAEPRSSTPMRSGVTGAQTAVRDGVSARKPDSARQPMISGKFWLIAGVIVVALAGYGGSLYQENERRMQLLQRLESGETAVVLSAIGELQREDREARQQLLVDARRLLMQFFEQRYERLTQGDVEQIDFAQVEAFLKLGGSLYSSAPELQALAQRLEQLKGSYVSRLANRIDLYLLQGRLLPSDDREDLPEVLAKLKRMQPDHPALADARIEESYALAIRNTMASGQLSLALELAETGLALVPESSTLLGLQADAQTLQRL